MVLVRTFIATPIYSKWFKMHDCMVAVMGALVSIEQAFVFATAMKGWHMYYGAAISSIGSIEGTPLTSQLSKMVHTTEFGKIFTLVGTASSIAMTVTSSGFQVWRWHLNDMVMSLHDSAMPFHNDSRVIYWQSCHSMTVMSFNDNKDIVMQFNDTIDVFLGHLCCYCGDKTRRYLLCGWRHPNRVTGTICLAQQNVLILQFQLSISRFLLSFIITMWLNGKRRMEILDPSKKIITSLLDNFNQFLKTVKEKYFDIFISLRTLYEIHELRKYCCIRTNGNCLVAFW